MVNINKKIGARLKCFREEKGLSVLQVSKILGISEAHYRRIERGEHDMGVQKLYDLTLFLNLDPRYLITGERKGEIQKFPGLVREEPPAYLPDKITESSTATRPIRSLSTKPIETSKPIIFSAGHNRYPVAMDDILYLESVNRAVIVHTRKEIIRIPSLRLAGFMEQYGDSFIRIHRTMVVNKDKIRRYNNSRLFVEINETGEKLPVGRTYSEYVRKAFDENGIRGYNR